MRASLLPATIIGAALPLGCASSAGDRSDPELLGTFASSNPTAGASSDAVLALTFEAGGRYVLWRATGCPTEESEAGACDEVETGASTVSTSTLRLTDDASGRTRAIPFSIGESPLLLAPRESEVVERVPLISRTITLAGAPYDLVPRRQLPSFAAMWDAYPKRLFDLTVQYEIGGEVKAPWLTNLCVVRVSRALDGAGFLIPEGPSANVPGLHTLRGADGNNYAYRVAELRDYLVQHVGPPDVVKTGAQGVDPAPFAGKQGIILFTVPSFTDATGHADLWNGSAAAHAQLFPRASKVELWQAPP
jgi:hypothetical protein